MKANTTSRIKKTFETLHIKEVKTTMFFCASTKFPHTNSHKAMEIVEHQKVKEIPKKSPKLKEKWKKKPYLLLKSKLGRIIKTFDTKYTQYNFW